jgi:hypothetical protein
VQEREKNQLDGPGPTSYFSMGRSELRESQYYKFPRERRILPGERAQMKPDYT